MSSAHSRMQQGFAVEQVLQMAPGELPIYTAPEATS